MNVMNDITSGQSTSYVDDMPKRRPGVPAERTPPSPVGNAHWLVPPKQEATGHELIEPGKELTATFGTGQPPRAFSGWIRKRAYKIPDYRIRRWVLLLLADRIDSFESRFLPAPR